MKRWKIFLSGAVIFCVMNTLCTVTSGIIEDKTGKDAYTVNNSVFIDTTDKAMYKPGDVVFLTGKITVSAGKELSNPNLVTKIYHLESEVDQMNEPVALKRGGSRIFRIKWQSPSATDYTGYLIKVELQDSNGTVLASDTIGVDVSSDWTKFPRYGYVCRYEAAVDTAEKINKMNRFHINGIEYYDWQYLHQKPLPDTSTRDNPGTWEDWSGRVIDGNTVASYIEEAHEKDMINMGYDMIYAGTNTFFNDDSPENNTKAASWRILFSRDNPNYNNAKYDDGDHLFHFNMGNSPSGNGRLYFFNPLNRDWQKYIFAEENHIFTVLDFDGWHGDTVGDWGKMTDVHGNPLGYDENGNSVYYVKDTYRSFLNAAKAALGSKYLSFNPVGAQGIEQADTSNEDVLYAEFWPWDKDLNGITYDTYSSIVTQVERSMKESIPYSKDGKGKSLVVKAYVNYNRTEGFMNNPAVLLFDAAVYAAGGSRLELGDGDRMLHKEYYPDDDILMDDELRAEMIRWNDFAVAYENILRDGQSTVGHEVDVNDYKCSKTGESNKIWTYTREDTTYEILHLINLLGTDNTWRDADGTKSRPEEVSGLKVKYYTDKDISHIYLASPDLNNGCSTELAFEKKGTYYTFTVPSLEFWDMIYMKVLVPDR